MVRYGVHNGFDAWRRLFNRYVPFVEDLLQILIQELYDLEPVTETDVDKLFNDIQRTSEWYISAGSESVAEKWLVAVVKRHLQIKIAIDLSIGLRQLIAVGDIRNAINIYRHDHRTGLPRGVPGTMQAMIEQPPEPEQPVLTQPDYIKIVGADIPINVLKIYANDCESGQEELYVVFGGGKANGGKGCGQGWECREYPRRECPKCLERMKGKGGHVVAPKGTGENGKTGKGRSGKGSMGKRIGNGNGYQGYRYNNHYKRSPGKAVGKCLNNYEADYYEARGDDPYGNWILGQWQLVEQRLDAEQRYECYDVGDGMRGVRRREG